MSTNLAPYPRFKAFVTGTNQPLVGGKLYAYLAGTSTPTNTYTDITGNVANAWPVILDANGEADIWLNGQCKLVLQDANGVQIWSKDNIGNIQQLASQVSVGNYSSLTTAITQIGSTPMTLVIDVSTTLTGNTTVPTNITLQFVYPGAISKNGFTLTLNGIPVADRYKIFSGFSAGDITFGPGAVKEVFPEWWGALGDGSTDNATPFAVIQAITGLTIRFTGLNYKTSVPLYFIKKVSLKGEKSTRISLTAASSAAVIELDGAGGYIYDSKIEDIILDGLGNCPDGLYLKNGVIASSFSNVRATNVTVAGLHLSWAQSCEFRNFTCSTHVEAFTTQPTTGILTDGGTMSSDNIWINPIIEGVSGAGIKLLSSINSFVINGTSESNNTGITLGEPSLSQGVGASYNSIIGGDFEVNATSDILCRHTGIANYFKNITSYSTSMTGFSCIASDYNIIDGGLIAGISFDGSSIFNKVTKTQLKGTGKTITDSGGLASNNTWEGVFNITDFTVLPDQLLRRRQVFNVAGAGTATIDASLTGYAEIFVNGSTLTVATPTNPADGQELDITIFNSSGGATTVTWGAGFRSTAGWTNPANTKNRSARFRYIANLTLWYPISFSQTDELN